ncbi:TPA: elongation factor G [Candidatus Daviesbacteria bacterium]|uniref:Elongation factor G n=1 Tax=Candidatus Daviesbacteria bacterium GW2011_GWF2_38_6 TaxID=1618432 RepID=A0A0G0NNS0_9BACT|nr:MAG: Elongation factor G [Candidatus Daviesbacteria bacterium GW2011_GWA2_38_17]KKQ78726.1 MAG: Elongation factor G [Candidatus Daviesbacteria bacterium GW2011_GWF2_38_6]OGE44644.1 MAG: translation elongation factor G [Candidatus Daviesbacteria bacterium RIFCSPHIGHO2_12_FULL_38_25]OGE68653.1 MAG: translation elongation factor G [Candidatus Daviesbacteria bacterium RIFCSPLOWO2_02_FULL_38_18]OGE72041.1 MAG: translation elongation factor G [Candidatus Daviesbacteria bacterium RIFCSPLOWO2_12_FUL
MAIQKTKRDFPLDHIRNIGIIAHIDAGKTTTTERILFYTGKTYKIGNIDEGTTVTDWMEQEKERGITIVSAAITTFWKDFRINIIDTPGHVDFTAEVERSLRVLDGGVIVLDASSGVQSQTETVWRQANKYSVPLIAFANKMDVVGADFLGTIQSARDKLGANAIAYNLPIGKENDFKGVVDLLTQKAIIWEGDETGAKFHETEISADMVDLVKIHREKLVEEISGTDDVLMEKFLEGQEINVEELKKALRVAVIANKIVPVLAGSSLRNKGVQPMLDCVVEYLPSPQDVTALSGIDPLPQSPLSALAFKIQVDPHVGKLTYIRVYSGTLKSGSYVYNSTKQIKERVGRLLLMHANDREEIDEAYAGEIVAAVGLKDTKTGDTLCDETNPIILESINFPDPVISLAIEPKTKSDQERLGYALNRLSEEDPTFRVKSDQETGQTIIAGMGELQLEVLVDRMKREFKVEASVGQPQVAYKETITKEAEGEGKYIRQTGGRGQYGHCLLRIEPLPRGQGREFESKVVGGAIPREFIPPIEKGVIEKEDTGILAGYPVTDIKVTVFDGSFHDVDSSEIAFKIAGSLGLSEACKKADMILIEPIMKVEVTTPEEFLGDIIGDLSSKRAQILSSEARGNAKVVIALVPLAEMHGYATSIRSMSQGRATYYMEADHYEPVPQNITAKIVESSGFTGRVEH